MVKRLQRILKMNILTIIKKVIGYDEIFTCAYRMRNHGDVLQAEGKKEFSVLPYSRQYWYADPLTFVYKDITYVFMEMYDRKKNKGCIAYSYFTDEGVLSKPKKIIEDTHHFSFPTIFEVGNEIYMLPETSSVDKLCLYRAEHFPDVWVKEEEFATEFPLVDTVVLKKEKGIITLLTSANPKENPFLTKFQIYKLSLQEGMWSLAENSVFNRMQEYTYVSRNAGAMIHENGKNIHVTQTSTDISYGLSLVFSELGDIENNLTNIFHKEEVLKEEVQKEAVNKEAFQKEITIKNVSLNGLGKKEILGMHTYSRTNRYEVIDVKFYDFYPMKWIWRFR